MDIHKLEENARRILVFVCQNAPEENPPQHFQRRNDIAGSLRLSLSEYDDACRQLVRHRLIVTDPPAAPDCDNIAPTPAGRQLVAGGSSG
jgi:hypothetical protein